MQTIDLASVGDYTKSGVALVVSLYALGKFIFIPRAKAFVRAELRETIALATALGGRMDALEKDAAGTQRALEKLGDNVEKGFERITIAMTAINVGVTDNAIKTAELVGELKGRREHGEERRP